LVSQAGKRILLLQNKKGSASLSLSDQIRAKMTDLEKAIGSGKTEPIFDEVEQLFVEALWTRDISAIGAYRDCASSIFRIKDDTLVFLCSLLKEPRDIQSNALRLLHMAVFVLEKYASAVIKTGSPSHLMLDALYGAGSISTSSVAVACHLTDLQVLQTGASLESKKLVQRTFGGTVVFWGITPEGCRVRAELDNTNPVRA
jgi:hypothetical protein